MRWVSGAAATVLVLGWLLLRMKCGLRYAVLRSLPMEGLRLRAAGEPFLLLIEKWRIGSHLPSVMFRIQRSLQRSYGVRYSPERTLLFTGEMLSYSWLFMLGGSLLTLLSGEEAGFILGVLLALILPAALVNDLHKKVKLREQGIMLELPELQNSIVLLVGAGETVQRAIVRCVESRKGDYSHPLYKELFTMITEWEGGYSFQQAFENFSKRCAVQEVSLFTTTVLLNYRRGGADFVLSLRDLSRMLWEKRKALSRTRGEQASSKLVFPMVLIFLIVIVLVGTPAIMMLKM
ncbi:MULTISPECIES: type II secretion system F family protein [unclassified Paenibacillus]|uniref:type II secretion system F family protein n=1 Tax=unclassified Paenibacillus TaxID=185978 RepID=UPI0024055008|nr:MULTISPECIES: type II secretion system F family protein [unclassified Paenibacillus]MDF9842024.1 tight adherence protein C [Paenibacillus sp. PastF-2]MDF9848722.1 tight adherence protein C [Paenibacillus sp. PastM-2]MDF9855292.1 tight adherence protein C [Paenibacillus sp. PastF-1]MDH6480562.1 tight adherence protein C [Paenibacillus sp. PastH-2]MDH6507988.1 tight adherence protein C [Paenibacillus sp. PastM-3]